MRNSDATCLDELRSPWPSFLDDLDSDRDRARLAFIDLAYRYLTVSPPRALYWDRWGDPATHIADILEHFLRNDFQQLRKYRNKNQPFLYWFRRVADNKARDIMKRKSFEAGLFVPAEETEDRPAPVLVAADAEGDPLLRDRIVEAIDYFRGTECHCLLVWRLQRGYTNKEITRLMRYPERMNAAIGNRFRECRLKLIDQLQARGITPGDLV